MDMTETEEDHGFRDEVRDFIRRALDPATRAKVRAGAPVGREELKVWQDALRRQGWLVPAWPREWEGTGWSLMRRHIFEDECARNDCPPLHSFNLGMIGPILLRYGTSEQQREHLPRILASTDWWCQGYSEPEAGSDLAALRTRADRDGDAYVVNGTKIWTSLAHWANRMFCLVRTDRSAKPQEGISFLLLDMTDPGVTVRPIVSISGQHAFNQVFLENVRVPFRNLVHRENAGWTVAKSLLEHERLSLSRVGENKKALRRLREIASRDAGGCAPLIRQDWFRRKVAQLDVRLRALEVMVLRFIAESQAGRELGPGVSMLKLRGSTLLQDILQTTVEALGLYGLPFAPPQAEPDPGDGLPDLHEAFAVSSARFQARGYTIAGGSSEVQRTIMARHVLGLAGRGA